MAGFEKEFIEMQRQRSLQNQGLDPLMQGGPLDSALGSEIEPSQKSGFLDLMTLKTAATPKQALMSQLIQVGVSPQEISFNSLGRSQIEEQLRRLYGSDFAKNPAAVQVLQAFDSYMDTDTGKLADVKMKSDSQNILKALMDYGKGS